MQKLKNFIDKNLLYYQDMGGEVEEHDANQFDSDIVEFLKQNGRFDYKDICAYYVSEVNEVWIEYMGD